jgi:hypothetical protein
MYFNLNVQNLNLTGALRHVTRMGNADLGDNRETICWSRVDMSIRVYDYVLQLSHSFLSAS